MSQGIATVLFFVLVTFGGIGMIKNWAKNRQIASLEKQLTKQEAVVEQSTSDRKFILRNLEILKKNCGREVKPVIVEGKLRVENLFDVNPR